MLIVALGSDASVYLLLYGVVIRLSAARMVFAFGWSAAFAMPRLERRSREVGALLSGFCSWTVVSPRKALPQLERCSWDAMVAACPVTMFGSERYFGDVLLGV
jgi:hypothetical protein